MLTRRLFGGCAVCSLMGLVAAEASGQTAPPSLPGVSRTLLGKSELPGDKYITILASIEIAPGTKVPRHTHPGVESTYVLDGEGDLFVQGQPDRRLKGGEGFQVPTDTPHSVNVGDRPLKLAVTYAVDKNRPLLTLVPES